MPCALDGPCVASIQADRESAILRLNAGKHVPAPLQFLTAVERPRCSRCQARMMLERASPGPIGFERRLFECPRCDHVETSLIALDPFNPMRPVGPPANSERKTE
jgi:hypothetical protein